MASAGADQTVDSAGWSSIRIDHRDNRTLFTGLLMRLIGLVGARAISSKDGYGPGSPELYPPPLSKYEVSVESVRVENIWTYEIKPHRAPVPNPEKRKRIYYFAGGAFENVPSPPHWLLCAKICHELNKRDPHIDTTLIVVSYPLAPLSPAPASFPALEMWYRFVVAKDHANGTKFIFAGDSSGGCMALALPLHFLTIEPALPAPSSIFAMSPALDNRCSNPDIPKIDPYDPLLNFAFIKRVAATWRDTWDEEDPRVSPLLGDFSLLKERGVVLNGLVGGYDVLTPDARELLKKLNEVGVKGSWLVWEKLFHCFPLLSVYLDGWGGRLVAESSQAAEWMIQILLND